MTADFTACLANACAIKQQMNDHFDAMHGRITQPSAFDRSARLAGRIATHQYGPAIQALIAATTHDDLVERCVTLDRRLNKGWAWLDLRPAETDAHDAWDALLLEYTVLSDALSHIGATQDILDRIKHIEGMVQHEAIA
jgi:hypothetical protein